MAFRECAHPVLKDQYPYPAGLHTYMWLANNSKTIESYLSIYSCTGSKDERGVDKINRHLNRSGFTVDDEEGKASSIYNVPWFDRFKHTSWIHYVPFVQFYDKTILDCFKKQSKD